MKLLGLFVILLMLITKGIAYQQCRDQEDLEEQIKNNPKVAEANAKIEKHWSEHRKINHGHRKKNLGDLSEEFKRDRHVKKKFEQETPDAIDDNGQAPNDQRKGGKRRLLPEDQLPDIMEIPITVWVLHDTDVKNALITYEEITNEISKLNRAFLGINPDKTTDWRFVDKVGNFQIQFKLDEIIRKRVAKQNSRSAVETLIKNTAPASGVHDHEYSLNLWLVTMWGNLGYAGFAQFPETMDTKPLTDGVVLDFGFFGTSHAGLEDEHKNGVNAVPHEIGHWLNLRHIWGDGGCGADDFVEDTQMSDRSHYGPCPAEGTSSCGTPDMYMNFMSYAQCMNMFTKGQVDRSWDLFETGGAREHLTDYVTNPSPNDFVNAVYFIKSAVEIFDTPCDLLDKWNSIDLNPRKTTYNYFVYMCLSYTNNQKMAPVTDFKWVPASLSCAAGYDRSSVVIHAPYAPPAGGARVACIKSEPYSATSYDNSYIDINLYSVPVSEWSAFPTFKDGYSIDKSFDFGTAHYGVMGYAKMKDMIRFKVTAHGSNGMYMQTNVLYNGVPVYKRLYDPANPFPNDPRVIFYYGTSPYKWVLFSSVEPRCWSGPPPTYCDQTEIKNCAYGVVVSNYDSAHSVQSVAFNDKIAHKKPEPQVPQQPEPNDYYPQQPLQQPPASQPFTILLNSTWVMTIAAILSVVLILNIMFMCYMNCRPRISFNKNRRSGYDSVKHADSEEFDDSEANLINVNQ